MAEIHLPRIPINPTRDRWGDENEDQKQVLAAGHNDHDAEIELLKPIPGRVDAVEAEVEGLIEGVIPDLTDAGMAAVARSGGEFTEELTAQNATLRPDGFTYNPDETIDTSTEGGITTTYTWNIDGSIHSEARLGKTKTYTYDGSGRLTGSDVA